MADWFGKLWKGTPPPKTETVDDLYKADVSILRKEFSKAVRHSSLIKNTIIVLSFAIKCDFLRWIPFISECCGASFTCLAHCLLAPRTVECSGDSL